MSRLAVLSVAVALAGGALMAGPATAGAAEPLFAFIYRPGPAWKAGVPMAKQDLRPHGGYIARLAKEGRVLGGGGFVGLEGGMAVVRAPDRAAAERLLAEDPAIISGVFEADLREWRPRFGSDPDLAPPAPTKPTPDA